MRYMLDTNIISNLVKPQPSESLLAWLADRNDAELYIATFTIAEMNRGILEMADGKRRDNLATWFAGPEGPQSLFAGRTLGFDTRAALIWSQLMADGKVRGRPRSALDMIIAAVAAANDCIMVTDNERDFEDIAILNPLRM